LTDADKQNNREKYTVKLNATQKKQAMQKYSKTKLPGSVVSYDPRPGNEVGLFNNAPVRGE